MQHKLQSMFLHKCPRCLEGDLYPDMNPYHLRHTATMNERCPHCGLNFIPEPGYYYGAMYVSYGFTILISLFLFLIYYLFLWDFGIKVFLAGLIFILLILAPYTMRTSRAIWLSIFNHYDQKVHDKVVSGKV